MIVLHHNLTIGGGLLTPSVEHFDLFGNGEVATPFKFKPTSILQVNEVECHSWKTIKAIKTRAHIESSKYASPNIKHFTSAMAIPPYLTQSIISLQAPFVAGIFLETLKVAAAHNKDKTASVPTYTESLKEIIVHLWTAHHGHIKSVKTSPHVSPAISKLVNKLPKEYILSSKLDPKPRSAHIKDLIGPPTVMDQMNARLGQLVSKSIM